MNRAANESSLPKSVSDWRRTGARNFPAWFSSRENSSGDFSRDFREATSILPSLSNQIKLDYFPTSTKMFIDEWQLVVKPREWRAREREACVCLLIFLNNNIECNESEQIRVSVKISGREIFSPQTKDHYETFSRLRSQFNFFSKSVEMLRREIVSVLFPCFLKRKFIIRLFFRATLWSFQCIYSFKSDRISS